MSPCTASSQTLVCEEPPSSLTCLPISWSCGFAPRCTRSLIFACGSPQRVPVAHATRNSSHLQLDSTYIFSRALCLSCSYVERCPTNRHLVLEFLQHFIFYSVLPINFTTTALPSLELLQTYLRRPSHRQTPCSPARSAPSSPPSPAASFPAPSKSVSACSPVSDTTHPR